MSTSELLVTIEVLDENGNVLEERNVTTYRKLLEAAHAGGLKGISTEVVSHDGTVIVRATVTIAKGSFTGIGDASPDNVPEKLKIALPRVAETRAVCRALRAALGVGFVSVEELSEKIRFVKTERRQDAPREQPGDRRDTRNEPNRRAPQAQRSGDRNGNDGRPDDHRAPPERFRGRDDRPTEGGDSAGSERRAMSSNQKSLLFRLAYTEGHEGDAARKRVLDALGVERLEWATKTDASRAIEAMKRAAGNGQSNGAAHGPS